MAKRMAVTLLLALLAGLGADHASGQENGGEEDQSDRSVIALPAIGYSPEDGFILGGAVLFYSTPEPDAPTESIGGNVIYGTAGTFVGSLFTDHRIGERNLILETRLGLTRAYRDFYGIGMSPGEAQNYLSLDIDAQGSLLFPLNEEISLGPAYSARFINLLDPQMLGGSTGTFATGPGMIVRYDGRDSNVYTREGVYAELRGSGFPSFLGSSDPHYRGEADFRGFVPLGESSALGAQAVALVSAGEVPFQLLPTFGGSDLVRGILEGKFRDRVALAAQSEFRFPILGRFSGVAFIGAGRVGENIPDAVIGLPVAAGGAGLRFAVDPEQNLNLRVDIAYDGESPAFYINFMEAF